MQLIIKWSSSFLIMTKEKRWNQIASVVIKLQNAERGQTIIIWWLNTWLWKHKVSSIHHKINFEYLNQWQKMWVYFTASILQRPSTIYEHHQTCITTKALDLIHRMYIKLQKIMNVWKKRIIGWDPKTLK